MNLPNKLTMLRIVLVPVFMVCAAYHWMLAAGIVFAVASFTDFLGGNLARKYHLVTDFGKFADPLADRLLTTTAFVYMMADGVCHPVVIVLILAREFAVSGLRMVAAGAPGGKVIAANMWGKVKTVTQIVAVVLVFLMQEISYLGFMPDWFPVIAAGEGLLWLAAVATVVSGAVYLWENRSLVNAAK